MKKEDYSLADRWIRARLNDTIADVTQSLDEYRFNDAAGHIYQFIWQEFCDWYLELIKPALYSKDNPGARLAAQETMITVLRSSLELMHPFMPFVTEEIWQKISKSGPSIMVAPFPVVEERFRDDAAESDMGLLMEIIGTIRNIKGEKGISPSKKLKAMVMTEEKNLRAALAVGDALHRQPGQAGEPRHRLSGRGAEKCCHGRGRPREGLCRPGRCDRQVAASGRGSRKKWPRSRRTLPR